MKRFAFWLRCVPFVLVSAAALAAPPSSAQQSEGFLQRPELRAFIDRMVAKHDFNSVALVDLFSQAQPRPDIIEAISRPAEAKPWYEYRPIFLTDSRIEQGVEFWNENADTLARAESKFGVPARIIVAIIGIETRYGRHQGRYPVLDALSTLAFDYPKRGEFFRSELENYLLLTREEGFDAAKLLGSYAGAMGGGQFISSSYRHYAVDFDHDGKRDLWDSMPDVIGSVANYFNVHGWRTGEAIAVPAKIDGDDYQRLDSDLKPRYTVEHLRSFGVEPVTRLPDDTTVALIRLEQAHGEDVWLGLHNFYVITRYNHSALYAMAAYQLAEEIAARRTQADAHTLKQPSN